MSISFFQKYRILLIYGLALAGLLLLLKLIELKFLIYRNSVDIYVTLIALLFTGLGMWLALKITKPKIQHIIIEKEILPKTQIDADKIEQLGISKRELEILEMMAKGYSNQEISSQLFISLSTVKSHVSNILNKLDAKRRTQAIEIAKNYRLI